MARRWRARSGRRSTVDVAESGGRTSFEARASLVVVDGDGRMDMLETRARASVAGTVPESRRGGYVARWWTRRGGGSATNSRSSSDGAKREWPCPALFPPHRNRPRPRARTRTDARHRSVRNFLVDTSLQLRLASYLLAVGVLLSVGLGWLLWQAYQETSRVIALGAPEAGESLAGALANEDRGRMLLVAAALASVLLCLLGAAVVITHRIAGPAFAIGRTCRQVAEGNLTAPAPAPLARPAGGARGGRGGDGGRAPRARGAQERGGRAGRGPRLARCWRRAGGAGSGGGGPGTAGRTRRRGA